MGTLHCPNFKIHLDPPPATVTKASAKFTPYPLQRGGVNIQIMVGLGSAYYTYGNKDRSVLPPLTSVYGHLDTGASISVIDIGLAKYLGLKSTGVSQITTAGGKKDSSYFIVDLHFANSTLAPFVNLPVASTDLEFNPSNDLMGNPQNFGMLIGRDVMASWNIMWCGPTSTVIIND